jgi:hypothetical protein
MRFAVFLSMVLGIVTLSAQDHVLSLQQINRLGAKVPAPAYNMKETDRASSTTGRPFCSRSLTRICSHPPSRRGRTGSWVARIESAS